MYVCVSTMNKVKCGEPLVMKADGMFDQIGVYTVGGKFVGYVAANQPDGCVGYETVSERIGGCRIICKSAVCFDGTLVVSTDSPLLNTSRYVRREVEGYGMLLPV